MKKLFITLTITGLISFLFGNYIFNTYKRNIEETIKNVSSLYEKIYILQYGSYKDKEKAMDNNLPYYILEEEDGFFKIYVGVSITLSNAERIKGIYEDLGHDIYIKEKQIDNITFIDLLNSYDNEMNGKDDEKIIDIQKKLINKYKELILNE